MHRHLTERAHNDICRDAADNVGQQYAGSGHFNGVGRAVKKPGADGGTQGHKADVPGA